MKINNLKPLKPGTVESTGFFRSIGAYIIDMAFTIALMVGMYFICNGPIYRANNGKQAFTESAAFLVSSSLLQEDSTDADNPTYSAFTSSNVPVIRTSDTGKDGYQVFEEKVIYYYTDFCLNNEDASFVALSAKPTKEAAFTWLNENLYNLSSTLTNNDYYEPDKTSGVNDFTKAPVLKASIQEKVASRDEKTLNSLYEYYFSATNKSGLYVTAFNDVYNQPYLVTRKEITNNITYLSRLPGVIISPLIFFIILPLCLKNGKTLGKLFLGLSVIDKRGYKAKKWQILVHYLFIYVYWMFLLVNSLWLGIILAAFMMILDYIIRIISQRRLSIHDYMAYTMVVDKSQPFYESAKAQEDDRNRILHKGIADKENDTWENKYSRKNPDLSALKAEEKLREAGEVLDSSNIGKARDDAKNITSFDDYESKNDSTDKDQK